MTVQALVITVLCKRPDSVLIAVWKGLCPHEEVQEPTLANGGVSAELDEALILRELLQEFAWVFSLQRGHLSPGDASEQFSVKPL